MRKPLDVLAFTQRALLFSLSALMMSGFISHGGVEAKKCRKIAFILEKEVEDFFVTTFQLTALFMKRN